MRSAQTMLPCASCAERVSCITATERPVKVFPRMKERDPYRLMGVSREARARRHQRRLRCECQPPPPPLVLITAALHALNLAGDI